MHPKNGSSGVKIFSWQLLGLPEAVFLLLKKKMNQCDFFLVAYEGIFVLFVVFLVAH